MSTYSYVHLTQSSQTLSIPLNVLKHCEVNAVQRKGSIGIKGIETHGHMLQKWNSRERAVKTYSLWKKSCHHGCVVYVLLSLMWLLYYLTKQRKCVLPLTFVLPIFSHRINTVLITAMLITLSLRFTLHLL